MRKVIVKTHSWGRYLHRLFNRYEDVSRDFNEWKIICFKHRVNKSLCHCNNIDFHFRVTPKISIPPKSDIKAWQKLKEHLIEFGDEAETVTELMAIPVCSLTKNEKLLLRLLGIRPDVGYSGNIRTRTSTEYYLYERKKRSQQKNINK